MNINWRVIVGLDRVDELRGVDIAAIALLHVSEKLLSEEEQGRLRRILDSARQDEATKPDVHEKLCKQRVQVASVGQVS